MELFVCHRCAQDDSDVTDGASRGSTNLTAQSQQINNHAPAGTRAELPTTEVRPEPSEHDWVPFQDQVQVLAAATCMNVPPAWGPPQTSPGGGGRWLVVCGPFAAPPLTLRWLRLFPTVAERIYLPR